MSSLSLAGLSISSSGSHKKASKWKNCKIDCEELLRRRKETLVVLRKGKKETELENRRQLFVDVDFGDDTLDHFIPIPRIIATLKDDVCSTDEIDGSSFLSRMESMVNSKCVCLRAAKDILLGEFETNVGPKPGAHELIESEIVRRSATPSLVVTSFVNEGVYSTLTSLLVHSLNTIGHAVSKILQNEIIPTLAIGASLSTSEQLVAMIQAGIHRPLILLMSKSTQNVRLASETLRCLTFLMTSSADLTAYMINEGFLHMLIAQMEYASSGKQPVDHTYVKVLSWAVQIATSHPTAGTLMNNREQIEKLFFALNTFLRDRENYITFVQFMTTAEILARGSSHFKELMFHNTEIVRLAVEGTADSKKMVTEASVKFLSVASSLGLVDPIVTYGFLRNVHPLLQDSSHGTNQYDTVVLLSNLVAAGKIDELITNNVTGIVSAVIPFVDYKTLSEITFLYRNIIDKGTPSQVQRFVERDFIYDFAIQLDVKEPVVLLTAVHIYEYLLQNERSKSIGLPVALLCEQSRVVRLLEKLSTHDNLAISESACRLLDTYFDESRENMETV